MVRIKTNLVPCYKHTKSYKQIENIILNISFDRKKHPRVSSFFRNYVKGKYRFEETYAKLNIYCAF